MNWFHPRNPTQASGAARLGGVWLCLLLSTCVVSGAEENTPQPRFSWSELPNPPKAEALHGSFFGTSHGALLFAGGTHCQNPWEKEAGESLWSDAIWVLENPETSWREAGALPRPLAFGASAPWRDGLIVVGGRDAREARAEVFFLQWDRQNRKVRVEQWPPLKAPRVLAGAAVLKEVLYVVGGNDAEHQGRSQNAFWAMDLSPPRARWRWKRLEPLPGPERLQAAVAAQDGALWVFGGNASSDDPQQAPPGRPLLSAYRYQPRTGWRRIADLPEPLASSSAIGFGQSHLLAFGRHVLAYHAITDTWIAPGGLPEGTRIAGATSWDESVVGYGWSGPTGNETLRFLRAKAANRSSHFTQLDYLTVTIYLVSLVAMGVFFSRRMKSTEDFFLAGKRIPWWVAGISIRATQISSIGFMAMPAKAFATNWLYFLGILTIPAVCPLIIHFYLPFFRRLNVTSAYEYLEKRFNLGVRLFGSVVFIAFQLGRIGVVLYLPAIALSAVTGIDVYLCILLAGVLCTVYTVMGGIEAVVWTDLVQEIVLFGGPLLCLVLAIAGTDGGLWGYFQIAGEADKFHMFDWRWDWSMPTVFVVVVGYSLINLTTYTSDQAVIQRYLTTKDETQAVRAIWLNAAFAVPWGLLCFLLGTAFFTFYQSQPELLDLGAKADAVVPLFVARQLPAGLAGVVIAALFAATMSTVDSGMHSVSTVFVTDFIRRFQSGRADRFYLALARWTTVFLGIFGTGTALLMATYEIKSLWDLFFKLCVLLGSGLGGLFALGIFTRRAHGAGALVGALGSSAALYYVQNYTSLHFFLHAAVGFIGCFTMGYVASLLLPAPRRDLAGLTLYDMPARSEN